MKVYETATIDNYKKWTFIDNTWNLLTLKGDTGVVAGVNEFKVVHICSIYVNE